MILLTNDDGYLADGLRALDTELRRVARVIVIAPDREQSATSHSLTLNRPLRLQKIDDDHYTSDGTPTDCIMLAIHHLFPKRKPDLIVSGINHGANMGDDVTYSGTVAGAMEGAIIGVPSLAVSMADYKPGTPMKRGALFVARLIKKMDDLAIKPPTFLNVNLPQDNGRAYRRVEFTRLGCRQYRDTVVMRSDPRDKDYFWIGGRPSWSLIPGTDFDAVNRGLVSITPLSPDMTEVDSLERLQSRSVSF
jgi:5'-nucleotidase